MLTRTRELCLLILATIAWAFASLPDVAGAAQQAAPAQPPAQAEGSLSQQVGPDLEAGFAGDQARYDKAVKLVKERLAANPKDPEAMVWNGAITLFQSGTAYREQRLEDAGNLWFQSMKEMDEAVASAPENVAVRMVRGMILLPVTRFDGIPEAPEILLAKVREDFEKTLSLSKDYFEMMPLPVRAQVLGGLAESLDRLGKPEEARPYYQRVVAECSGTPQHKQAEDWLAKRAAP